MVYSFKKRGITIANVLQNILNRSKGKLNKLRVDKGSEFYKILLRNG